MLRRGVDTPIETKVKRGIATSCRPSTRGSRAAISAYVRVAGFDVQLSGALGSTRSEQLRQQAGNKLIGFIVDLRNNPGGNFDARSRSPTR